MKRFLNFLLVDVVFVLMFCFAAYCESSVPSDIANSPDLYVILSAIFKILGVKWTAGLAAVFLYIGRIVTWWASNKDEIKAIVLRVEKEAEDGWTDEEKLAFATDIYNKYITSKLPWYVKFIPKKWLMKKFIDIVEGLIEKSRKHKQPASENI